MYEDRLAGAITVTMKGQKIEEEIDFEDEYIEITANDLSLEGLEDNIEGEAISSRQESDLENHNDQENQEVNVAP